MILAEVSISSRLITLSVVGLLLILLSVLSLVNKYSFFTPARQSRTFHFGFCGIFCLWLGWLLAADAVANAASARPKYPLLQASLKIPPVVSGTTGGLNYAPTSQRWG